MIIQIQEKKPNISEQLFHHIIYIDLTLMHVFIITCIKYENFIQEVKRI